MLCTRIAKVYTNIDIMPVAWQWEIWRLFALKFVPNFSKIWRKYWLQRIKGTRKIYRGRGYEKLYILILLKEFIFPSYSKLSNPYIFATKWSRPLILHTLGIWYCRHSNLKYQTISTGFKELRVCGKQNNKNYRCCIYLWAKMPQIIM